MAEQCCGCGAYSKEKHPWVGVGKPEDLKLKVEPVTEVSERGFAAFGCCDMCFVSPHHRVFPLKMSFFARADADTAARLAGSNAIQMGGK